MLEDYPDLLTRKQAQKLLYMRKNRILTISTPGDCAP